LNTLAAMADQPRADRHSPHPYHRGDEVNDAFEVDGPSLVAGCEAAKVFHSAEIALDAVAVLISELVVGNDDLARSVGRNDGLGSHSGNDRPQGIAVISLVGQNRFAGLAF